MGRRVSRLHCARYKVEFYIFTCLFTRHNYITPFYFHFSHSTFKPFHFQPFKGLADLVSVTGGLSFAILNY